MPDMECLVPTPREIYETVHTVKAFSFEAKSEVFLSEEKTNLILDTILDIQKKLKEKTLKISNLVERIEGLTWFTDLDQESLMLMNDLIASIKHLHSSLLRQYVVFNKTMLKNGIAKKERKEFKLSLDDLKDVAEDLDSIFFFLPNIPEFKETTKRLSLI